MFRSHYGGRAQVSFVRVGSHDEPDHFPPDVHIVTTTKQPWIVPSGDVPVMDAYCEAKTLWPPASLERRAALFPPQK